MKTLMTGENFISPENQGRCEEQVRVDGEEGSFDDLFLEICLPNLL